MPYGFGGSHSHADRLRPFTIPPRPRSILATPSGSLTEVTTFIANSLSCD